jgi:uncharacterized protein
MDAVRPFLATGLLLLAAGCASAPGTSSHESSHPAPAADAAVVVSTPGGPVRVEVAVADTVAEQRRGLQGVSSLAPDAGMAFLFDGPASGAFWMKDTPLPLSIAFWGRDGRISAIMDMAPCRTDPCPTYRPRRPFVGALEVHQGFFARHGIGPGDRIAVVRG